MTVVEEEVQAQPSLGMLVVRALGVAALVIGVSAALFWSLGRGADDGLVVANGPDEDAAIEEPEAPEPDPGDDAAPDPDPEPEPAEPEPTEPDDGDDPDDGADPDPEEPTEPEQPDRIAPDTISVQVLDGYQADGGAAAAAVADELVAAGYRVVARNPAIRYELTTVLWTAGSQAAAEQIGREIGAAEVRQQPGNLAESVMVHVVVGADRG